MDIAIWSVLFFVALAHTRAAREFASTLAQSPMHIGVSDYAEVKKST